ncbi:hypothetical protein PHYSODRAFT_530724 [Phytophthora sojae]|uniref:Transcription initiation factor TFIID subunit 2 n=1 Tax=Phytophthora sojae (strain P6497) TaxID=1094619 RepID=G5ABI4_PHYSP|nr:hypothetical protein PHYSODRAFT_530724 [Phytophthora sojae]EGZ06709.1 hypothetical protein PHYSODRAFT_530724 [Phytophthora sojae]|eukprot:XP_009537473.1 hypothetical protein PHYSODRAFT_530724 [Phytophthora sojae]
MIGDFEYLQQRVALRVDVMRRHVAGVAEVVLAPRAPELRVLRLHARQLRVCSVRIEGVEAAFEQLNFLGDVVDENYRDLATFDLFYRGAITEVGTQHGQKLVLDAWDLERLPKSSTGFKPVVVRIEYDIEEPSGGLRFVLPDEQYQPKRSPHMYTYCGPFGGLCDGARSWMPCRDTLRDACTFRIELTVPDWCVAVCSGQMVQQVLNPEPDADGMQWRTFRYVVNPKTNCSSIGFAVGPFRLYVPPEMPRMTHFALPECFEDLVHCTSKLASAMTYFERALGASYPFKTYQQVFVEDLPDQLQYIAGGAIMDQNLLHGPRIIDRELPSHLAQVKGLVGSWIGGAVGIQSTKDAWVLIGVIGHLVNTYARSIYGEEEYGYRIQLAMDALTTMELTTDQQSPALLSSEVDVYSEYDPLSLTLLEVKAPLVLHMIEQRVGPKHLSIAIQRANASASTGKSTGTSASTEPLTTLSFLKTVKTIAGAPGQDLTKSFLTSWIIEPGMPFFTVGYWYNRKQTQAEVVLQQEIPPGGKLYTGPITITIVEDTSEYTYQKRIEHKRHKFDFPCHSKVRKKRRKRQGLADPDDSVSVGGPGMGLNDTPVFWVKIDTGCAWLRHVVMHQPDFNWMEQLLSDKKVGSRVHAARALALFHRPHEKPNVMSCRVLTECMSGLTTHSRRLRAEAAQSLGIWQSIHAPLTNANTQLPIWKAMHNLVRIFKEHFFDRATDMPLPNYFLPSGGKVILEALGAQQASISSKQIQSPPEIETFLLQLLTENDNSKNYVEMDDQSQVADDCYYIGNLVLSLSVLTVDRPARSEEGDVVREILRYLHYDQVQPSYNKTITVCCLEALCNLVLAGRCEEKLVNFHSFASPKHSNLVRKAAIESILRLYFAENPNGQTTSSLLANSYGATAAMLWLCELLKAEQSPGIRLFAVQVCLNCMRGFPPGVGKEVLATWDHSYTLGLMNYIEMKEPTSFVLKSPEKVKVLGLFDRPNLSKLRDDSSSAKRIVEELWNLMNSTAAMDQRLRVALIVLYRKVWGETTPIAVAHIVQDKAANWAGGYESLRLMMEESKNRMLMNGGGRGGGNTAGLNGPDGGNGLGRKTDDDRKRGFASAASSPADAALEQFRGKKFKFKMGDTTFRSHKL